MFIRRVWPAPASRVAGFPDLARVRRDMDQLFDVLWREGSSPASPGVFPNMNITQDGDKYYVRAELPGVKSEDLKISVENNKLIVAGERKVSQDGEGVSYHRRERVGGTFSRSLALPDNLDANKVEASYRNGILTVALPKAEAAKPRTIAVKTA